MIPDRDYYADKNGRLTDDPNQYARQVAVKGCFLDPRVAARFGIVNDLVSVDEPAAPRRITSRNEASVKIVRTQEVEEKPEEPKEPQEPAAAAEPEAGSEPEATAPAKKTEAKKPAAKKGEKKK